MKAHSFSHGNLTLRFFDRRIACTVANAARDSVHDLQLHADRFCPAEAGEAHEATGVSARLEGVVQQEGDTLVATWQVDSGQVICTITFAGHDTFVWRVTFQAYPYHLVDRYSLARLSWQADHFTHYLDPCLFEQVAAHWCAPLPETRVHVDTSGVHLGNNCITIYNASEAVLVGSLDFNSASQHTVTKRSAEVTIRHCNTAPRERLREGVYIADRTWEQCATRYGEMLEARGVLRPREHVRWHTEPQWCDWVPYRWDTGESRLLTNAEQIRASETDVRTIVIDAGWFDWLGDWNADADKFPSGMRSLVDRLHEMDFKVILWFCPHIVHPASKALETCRDFLVRNHNGSLYRSEHEGSEHVLGYFVDPTDERGVRFIEAMTDKLLDTFNADGVKIDYVYLHPTRSFVTHEPIEENDYVYRVHEIVARHARALKPDCLVSNFSFSAHVAELGDDIRAGDTFNGCNYRSLAVSQIKTKVAAYQHPYVLLVNDYIGSYDLPIEADVFRHWLEWIRNMPRAVTAYGWQPWDPNLRHCFR